MRHPFLVGSHFGGVAFRLAVAGLVLLSALAARTCVTSAGSAAAAQGALSGPMFAHVPPGVAWAVSIDPRPLFASREGRALVGSLVGAPAVGAHADAVFVNRLLLAGSGRFPAWDVLVVSGAPTLGDRHMLADLSGVRFQQYPALSGPPGAPAGVSPLLVAVRRSTIGPRLVEPAVERLARSHLGAGPEPAMWAAGHFDDVVLGSAAMPALIPPRADPYGRWGRVAVFGRGLTFDGLTWQFTAEFDRPQRAADAEVLVDLALDHFRAAGRTPPVLQLDRRGGLVFCHVVFAEIPLAGPIAR